MKEENLSALIAAIEANTRAAHNLAQMKAMDYVKSGSEDDRARAQAHLHDAELWTQARSLVLKHR